MTTMLTRPPVRGDPVRNGTPRVTATAARPALVATVIACGAPDRGDDGAAAAAVAALDPDALGAGVRLLLVDQLRVEDLVDAAALGRVVVADAAVGIGAGVVLSLSFARLPFAARQVRARSSHELPIVDTVGLAEMLLGRPLEGAIVALGVGTVVHGAPLSEPVRAALPRFGAAIVHAVRGTPADAGE